MRRLSCHNKEPEPAGIWEKTQTLLFNPLLVSHNTYLICTCLSDCFLLRTILFVTTSVGLTGNGPFSPPNLDNGWSLGYILRLTELTFCKCSQQNPDYLPCFRYYCGFCTTLSLSPALGFTVFGLRTSLSQSDIHPTDSQIWNVENKETKKEQPNRHTDRRKTDISCNH